MAVSAAQDFSLDLLWFLSDANVFKGLYPRDGVALDQARTHRPMVLNYINDPKNAAKLPALHVRLKKAMKRIGFYKGSNAKRTDRYFLKQLRSNRYTIKAPSGRSIRLYVYSDPSRTLGVAGINRAISRCRGARQGVCDAHTAVTCGYANYARILARRKGGRVIGLDTQREGLQTLWARIRKLAKNRRIVELSFLDHGNQRTQDIGKDKLSVTTAIPSDIANYFAANAQIKLYGCLTFSGTQHRKNVFAAHLAGRLLPHGGKVVGATETINVDVNLMTIKATELKKKLVSVAFGAWDGRRELEAILTLADQFAAGNKKLALAPTTSLDKSATAGTSPDVTTYPKEHPKGYPSDYPEDYPDRAYYT